MVSSAYSDLLRISSFFYNSFRVSYIPDPVSGLPTKDLSHVGYCHIWPHWYINLGNNLTVTVIDIDESNWNEEAMATTNPKPPPGYNVNVTTALEVSNIAARLCCFRQVSGCTLATPNTTAPASSPDANESDWDVTMGRVWVGHCSLWFGLGIGNLFVKFVNALFSARGFV